MKKTFLALFLLSAFICASASSSQAKPRKAKARVTASAKKSKKSAPAIAATPAAICDYIGNTNLADISNVATLKTQIAYARKLAPAVIKAFNAKNPASVNLSNPEKFFQYVDILRDYVDDRYFQNTAEMAYGATIVANYSIFVALYTHGCIADLLDSDSSRESYYAAVVEGEKFITASSSFITSLNTIGAFGGSLRSVEYPSKYGNVFLPWTQMIIDQYKILKGTVTDESQDLTLAWKEYIKKCDKLLHDAEKEVKDAFGDDAYGAEAREEVNDGKLYLNNAEGLAISALQAYQKWIAETRFADKAPLFEAAASQMLYDLSEEAKLSDD